jgi:hypothetical protein
LTGRCGSPIAGFSVPVEFRAEYATNKNETQAATTLINSKIDSVGFKEGKVILNTADGQAHDFASVSQIG